MRRTLLLAATFGTFASVFAQEKPPLAGTRPLVQEADFASEMIDGIDRFLLRKTAEAGGDLLRDAEEKQRAELARMLGVVEERVAFTAPEIVHGAGETAELARGESGDIFAVRWPAFADVTGEGLLLVPRGAIAADVIALPDADESPEQLAGLAPGATARARELAERGCRVLVPVLIERRLEARGGRAKLTSREFVQRPAFELGRTLPGYEVMKTLAAVDWFSREREKRGDKRAILATGRGEGALIALYATALDRRIVRAQISGLSLDAREMWAQPAERNVFGLLGRLGPRGALGLADGRLVIEDMPGPQVTLDGAGGGAPGKLTTASRESIEALRGANPLVAAGDLDALIAAKPPSAAPAAATRELPDAAARQMRQLAEIDRHNQRLLTGCADVRAKFMERLDFKSPEAFEKSQREYREIFDRDVIGRFDDALLPPNTRTRLTWRGEKWDGYEVLLDVFPDVIAYGALLVPKGIAPGERRPVVVCQHGLEGRPTDTFLGDNPAYHDFAARLAERGYVTFAPQNPYILRDRFRTLQRKANPLGKSLFSIIVPQHRQIVSWLKTLPFVASERIGFYGLSYGGKTAMRVPALVTDYALSICSADFNEWVWKNAASRGRYSYVFTNEYEIFEWDLGHTFNYAEMAALIAPRPFMVERGHFDGVAPDEAVGYEYAKVRHLYAAKLKLPERTQIEWFDGPHTINGKGTFDFLDRWLWPEKVR